MKLLQTMESSASVQNIQHDTSRSKKERNVQLIIVLTRLAAAIQWYGQCYLHTMADKHDLFVSLLASSDNTPSFKYPDL